MDAPHRLPRPVRIAAALTALLGAACASPPPPPTLEIANHSRRAITSVRATPCGGGASRELLRDEIERGQSRRLPLAGGCVDLVAVDPQGRVSGEQRNLVLLSDAIWTLR